MCYLHGLVFMFSVSFTIFNTDSILLWCQCSKVFRDFMMENYEVMLHIIVFWCLEIPYVFLYVKNGIFFSFSCYFLEIPVLNKGRYSFAVASGVIHLCTFFKLFFSKHILGAFAATNHWRFLGDLY